MARRIAGSAAAATMAWAVPSWGDAPCAAVQVSPVLSPAWSAAAQALVRQLAQLPASDCQPMTLSIEPAGAGVRLAAVALDGRRTERLVRNPESLVATALGLVIAIPASPAPATTATATASPPATPMVPASTVAPVAPPPPAPIVPPSSGAPLAQASAPSPSRKLALWVGFEAGGRLAHPTAIAMPDFAVDGTVLLDPWLVSVAIRSAPLGLVSSQGLDHDAFRQVSVGLGAGRRIRAGEALLDVILEPAVTAMRMEYDFTEKVESGGEDLELSVDAVVRLALPIGKSWALTFTLEGDMLPGNVGSLPARIDIPGGQSAVPPTFPGWESALRVGAMGALL